MALLLGSLTAFIIRFRIAAYTFLVAGISVLTQLVNWWLPFIIVLITSMVMTLGRPKLKDVLVTGSIAMLLTIIAEYVFYLGLHYGESIRLLEILSSLVGIQQ